MNIRNNMTTLLEECKFICSEVGENHNKFWYIRLYDDFSVTTEWGRVGDRSQSKTQSFGAIDEANSFVEKKCKEKTSGRKGYSPLNVVSGTNPIIQHIPSTSLEDIALNQIETNSPDTANLIKMLSKRNIHNIISATAIEYDESKGTFSTPCGIVTQQGIDEARAILDEMEPLLSKHLHNSPEFIALLERYLRQIPHKVGRRLIPIEIIPDTEALEKEYQILDALSASLQSAITQPVATSEVKELPKLFSVKLNIVTDDSIIKHIIKFFNDTKNSKHTSSSLKVKTVYSVEIDSMKTSFENKGRSIGNVMELWHGTRVENVLSILKSGLIIPKSGSKNVTGRLFGDGVYFSDQSTKSLNYAQGYWGHGSMESNCFMFLCDVAMGKFYIPKYCQHDIPDGYNSFYAQANKSGVMNNEMIIPNLYQCNLKYLVEFDK